MGSLTQAYTSDSWQGRLLTACSRSRVWEIAQGSGVPAALSASKAVSVFSWSIVSIVALLNDRIANDDRNHGTFINRFNHKSSFVVQTGLNLSRIIQAIFEVFSRSSFFLTLPALLTSYAKGSFLYHWLTTEPEPDVIVIDLRETWTAGPVIAGIDRTIAEITPGIHTSTFSQSMQLFGQAVVARPIRSGGIALIVLTVVSFVYTVAFGTPSRLIGFVHIVLATLGLVGSRSAMSAAELRKTRVVRVLIDAFEPPEPPDQYDRF